MRRVKHNHLKVHRKQSGLSQEEVAFLVTGARRGRVSKYERRIRGLSLRTALGFQVLFGAAAHELLPGTFAEVELSVLTRANLLLRQWASQRPSARLRRKARMLEALTDAAARNPAP
jgi:transcriptional regulator with XRE-family HTH domain